MGAKPRRFERKSRRVGEQRKLNQRRLCEVLERAMGIEPTSEAWEASILPLYDARSFSILLIIHD